MRNLYLNICILIFFNLILAECSGFNWFHDIDTNDCNSGDIIALKQFIKNSGDSLEQDMDINFNGKIDVLELGWQLWENGRLIHWLCQDVPSPYYFYEYDCKLSGKIPEEVGNLDAVVKLRLQNNNLTGNIPESICKLKNIENSSYWFNIENNLLCPPYPHCLEKIIDKQIVTNCK